jgi:YbbR domain-containing protein
VRRLINNWPQKLGALILALVLWYFVSTDETVIVQRSLLVPLQVEGLRPGQIAIGIPEVVEVTVSGPDARVNALRAESFDAILSLRNAEGEFERPVTINMQQGLNLVRVVPTEVIGLIESEREKVVPVDVALRGGTPPDTHLRLVPSAQEVRVRGRADPLEAVVVAMAPVPAEAGEHRVMLYPADANGKPVREVVVEPNEITVTVESEPVLHRREVPVVLEAPDVRPLLLIEAALEPSLLEVVGPREALEQLETVTARATLPTNALRSGRYTLEARPLLPEGVYALGELRAVLEVDARLSP